MSIARFSLSTPGRGGFTPVLLLFLLLLFPGPALAATPEPPVRDIWKAGDTTVTIIQDLPGAMSVDLFSGPASEQERQKYFTDGKAEAGFNVFLLRAGGKNVLFDTGLGTMRETPGRLWGLLPGLGVELDAVDLVLLTHMHGDHIGGLMKGTERAFPKAKVMVAKPELDFWLGLAGKDPGNANAAMVKAISEAYGDDIQLFVYGDTLLPGVTALNAEGHTPGHTVFQVDADGKTLLIIGDLVHSAPLQFALPDECAKFDMDVPKAIADRKRILELAAEKHWPVAGMHLPFPGFGTVVKEGKGYRWERQ
ncbi:MAG: MBL fold metallo-hydrolase [Desulfovibrionaceae bacterium]|nr:MBL fold metallo-hydrolase [Desulfovibrionaceae bacterium]